MNQNDIPAIEDVLSISGIEGGAKAAKRQEAANDAIINLSATYLCLLANFFTAFSCSVHIRDITASRAVSGRRHSIILYCF